MFCGNRGRSLRLLSIEPQENENNQYVFPVIQKLSMKIIERKRHFPVHRLQIRNAFGTSALHFESGVGCLVELKKKNQHIIVVTTDQNLKNRR